MFQRRDALTPDTAQVNPLKHSGHVWNLKALVLVNIISVSSSEGYICNAFRTFREHSDVGRMECFPEKMFYSVKVLNVRRYLSEDAAQQVGVHLVQSVLVCFLAFLLLVAVAVAGRRLAEGWFGGGAFS